MSSYLRAEVIPSEAPLLKSLQTLISRLPNGLQQLADTWLSYVDPATKKPLKARLHWAKQWTFLSLLGEDGRRVKASEWR